MEKPRAKPARRAQTVFPRQVPKGQMQWQSEPGQNKEKHGRGREQCSKTPSGASQEHAQSYAEKTCDKRQIF